MASENKKGDTSKVREAEIDGWTDWLRSNSGRLILHHRVGQARESFPIRVLVY